MAKDDTTKKAADRGAEQDIAAARAEADAAKLQEERDALDKARDHERAGSSGDERDSGLGNLHYGDEDRGELLKSGGAKTGGAFETGLTEDSALSPAARGATPMRDDPAAPPLPEEDEGRPAQDNTIADADAPAVAKGPGQSDGPALASSPPGARFAEFRNNAADAPSSESALVDIPASENGLEVEIIRLNKAPTDIQLDDAVIAENDAGGVIGTLSAADPNQNDAFSYAVVEDPSGLFEIVGDQLKLKDGAALDYEARDSYDIVVEVTDSAGASYRETLTINALDINEAPQNLQISNASVSENDAGAVVGDLSLTDQDAGDTHTFQASDDRFEIVDGQLKLKDGVALDHEAGETVSVTVTATDAGGLSTQATFDIAVGDVNEAPDSLSFSNDTVDENDVGAVVATLTSTDIDDGDTATYSIAEDSSGLFEVVGDQLKLKEGVALDHEAQDTYEITVQVTDSGGLTFEQAITVNVADVNEAPIDIALSGDTVAENDAGAVVANLTSSDPDAGDTATYSLADDPSGLFEVVGDQLKLKDGAALDHEAQESYQLTLEVTDSAGATYQETVTINVADVNEAPTDIMFAGDPVSVTRDAVVSGAEIATGQGGGRGTATVALPENADAVIIIDFARIDNSFEIEINGESLTGGTIQLQRNVFNSDTESFLQFEDGAAINRPWVPNTDGSPRIQAVITEEGVQFYATRTPSSGVLEPLELTNGSITPPDLSTGENTITVINPDSAGPDGLNAIVSAQYETPGYSVAENDTGAVVATLTSSDPDAGDTATYSIAEDSSGPFEVVGDQLKLKEGVALDHEAQDAYEVTVRVTDAGGLSYEETVTVSVADVNEAPTDIALSGDTVAENDAGAVVANLTSSDPDAGDTATYSIAEDSSGLFEVVGDQLKLKDGAALDHEAQEAYQLTLEVTDSAGATYQETVTINVADVNEAPTDIQLIVDESNLVQGGGFEEPDVNRGGWRGFSNDPSGAWDSANGLEIWDNLFGNQASEGDQFLELDYTNAQDAISQTVDTIEGKVYNLSFDAKARGAGGTDTIEVYWNGEKIGEVDPASTEWETNAFQVVGTGGEDVLEFREAGDENNSLGAHLDNVSLTQDATGVAENAEGVVIGILTSSDPDAGDTATYTLADDPSGLFEVVGDQLKLKDGAALDHEAQDAYEVTVRVTDAGGLFYEEAVTVNVADVNEGPTDIELSSDSVNENDAGAVVATLTSSDPDVGDTATYTLADDPSGLFEVMGDQLKLKDGAALDHEAQDAYDVTVRVTDAGGLFYEETVTVNVADVNEAPVDITFATPEEGAFLEQGGQLVIEAEHYNANNPGSGGHEWGASSIDGAVHVDDGDVFNNAWRTQTDVENNAPELTYQVQFDTPGDYYVHIRGASEDGPSGNADSVHIGLDGERLTGDGGLTGFGGGGLRWGARDTLTGEQVKITVDEAGTYELNLWAREDGVTVDKIVLTQDPNYSPSGEGPAESQRIGEGGALAETAADGTVVATLAAVDPDAADSHTFEIVDNNGNPVADRNFEIVGDEIRVKPGADLDFETEPSHDLYVKATDVSGASYIEVVSVDLQDVNEAPTGLGLSNDTIAENDPGAVVATLSANDPDAGDTASFAIVSDPSGAFEIIGDQLKLKEGVSLEHEDAAVREVVIEATDSAGNTYQETISINVENVNTAPVLGVAAPGGVGLAASYYDIGQPIRNLNEVDFDAAPDASGVVDSLNYMTGRERFWDGGPDNFFAAKYEGRLIVQEGGTYTIRMASDDGSQLFIDGQPVIDNDGLHSTRTRTVTLDLEEGAHDIEVRYFENGGNQTLRLSWNGPDTDGADQLIGGDAFRHGFDANNLSAPEDTPGAVIAQLTVDDADAGDTHTYAVSDDRFEVVEQDGAPTLKLKDGVSLDYETEGSVDISVTVTDAAGAADTADLTIAVNDVNAAPTIGLAGVEGLQASYYDVGRSISNLNQIDFDAAPDATGVVDSLNYETGSQRFWDGGPDNYFAAKYEGQLIVQEGGAYAINLASDDGSQLFIDGQPLIDNDGLHPTVTQSVTVNLAPGAHDVEIRYFENTGAQTLKLTWSGPDTGGETVLVGGDALRQPGTYGVGGGAVTENAPGAFAALLAAADPDGDALSFAVSDDRFEVVETEGGPALKLRDGVSLDYETETSVNVTVTAIDESGESASADLAIEVLDVEDGPTPLAGATPGADRLNGTSENDYIDGLAGDDRINAGSGDDTVLGGDGADRINSGAGADRLEGGVGDDRLSGQGGDDTVIGGAGDDRVNGGAGDDTFIVTGSNDGFDRVSGGSGDDAIVAGSDDTQIGLSHFNNNTETISADGHSNVTIHGNDANNTLSFSKTELDGVDAIDGGAGNDRITGSAGDDTILGGEGEDDLRGGGGADRIEGGLDNDRLRGQDGDDALFGGAGDDRLEGGAGDDALTGGLGDDTLIGGAGDDVFMYADGDGADIIRAGGGDWTDMIRFEGGIESLGEFGVDWTVELTRGSIDSVDADAIDLSQNADGVITLNDGSTIEFQDLEQIM